ncbi:MAG: AraC family transcriptional regulator [Verrucomicrobiae bacterium]|nr:AraC family transcriptional regulator [Verrucomicrobiae bacterium]
MMLKALSTLGLRSAGLPFLKRAPTLHAMPCSVGYERVTGPDYDWHGLKRGAAEFVLIQWTLSGRGLLEYEGQEREVGPGQAMLLHFPHNHRYRLPLGWPAWEFVYACLNGSDLLRLWKQLEARTGPLVFLPEDSAPVRQLVRLWEMVVTDRLSSPFVASAEAYALAMLLMEQLFSPPPRQSRHPGIKRVAEYCRRHFDRPFGVPEMAEMAGLSRHHFCRVFKVSEGMPPGEYLHSVRMTEATRLLSTPLSVKQISQRCGFTDYNYFCRAFKKSLGQSPGQLRKSGMY